MKHLYFIIAIVFLFISCSDSMNKKNKAANTNDTVNFSNINDLKDTINDSLTYTNTIVDIINLNRQLIKLSHHINTSANEYLPILSNNENRLYFSAMDRTGYFDFKLDFTKQSSSGGEDVFVSDLNNGIWEDARPIKSLNTNGHEVISQVLKDQSLLVTSNYPEKLGPKGSTPETETTDLFKAKLLSNGNYQLYHFPEPVNSIFTEADAIMDEDEKFILFVSDRPGHIGEYHKKGIKWNTSFWGNTDVYVSLKKDDVWSNPIHLGAKINSGAAERSPWLSSDGLTLFVSSNGYVKNKYDLDVYFFKRKDKNNWKDWEGPYLVKDASSEFDDWGYKEAKDGSAFIAKVKPLGFKPTQAGSSGDGFIRETNYRSGYIINGLQVASLSAEHTTDIYHLKKSTTPVFTLNDVFFELNSFKINKRMNLTLERLIDLIKQNENVSIEIRGYTDDKGDEKYNLELSLNRANSVKDYLLENEIKNTITTFGLGEKNPKYPNTNPSKKALNRRVEIYFNSSNENSYN